MKHVTPDQWAYVIVPFLVFGGIVAYLAVLGWDAGMRANLHRNPLVIFLKMISAGLERATGYPAWAMAGALSGLWSLGTAVVGLYWDVAWHIDFGRDKQLFTPPHTMIVIGLSCCSATGWIRYSQGVSSARISGRPCGRISLS